MPRIAPDACIAVFARDPVPGAVKTRLIPLLSAEGAASLHTRLVEHALVTATRAAAGKVELHCCPATHTPFFSACARRYGVRLVAQSDGNLGQRMFSAFESGLAQSPAVILIGTDCPALTPGHLVRARQALQDGQDAVLVPAEDGGYPLLALARVDPTLFQDMAWGTDRVLAQTRTRLQRLGWRWLELDTLWDVDRPADVHRLWASGLLDGPGAAAAPG